MRKRLLIVILAMAGLVSEAAFASVRAKPLKSAKHKFVFEPPTEWEITHRDEVHEPIKVSASSKDRTANVTVMAIPIGKESAASILAAMDRERRTKNELAGPKARLAKDALSRHGADDAALGRYVKGGQGPGFPVVQRALVVTRKDRAYVVLGAWQKAKDAEWSRAVEAAIASFKAID